MSSVSHTTAISLLMVTLLTLEGCGRPDEQHTLASDKAPSPLAVSAQQRQVNRTAFEEIAPSGWSLRSVDDGAATYLVSIPQKPSAPKIGVLTGVISLNGLNEPMVKLGRAVVTSSNETDHEREAASTQYPDFEGYEKHVNVGSTGYDLESSRDIHAVAYYNFEKLISCYGHAPGQFACYWGTHRQRMSLHFNSDDFSVVLPYVLSLPGAD